MMASTELVHQDSESSVSEELELLRNVYTEEMSILRAPHGETTRLNFHLTPSTADDKEKQYVYLDLCLALPVSYPQSPPTLSLLQSRGLADAHLTKIQEGLCELCSDLLGCPMVYQCVEWVKESLTNHNRPCGQCALCLSEFMEEEEFRKTDCYHYFHSSCFLRYISYHQKLLAEEEEEEEEEGRGEGGRERAVECPVCRKPLPNGSVCLRGSEGEDRKEEEEFVFVPSPALREWQEQMAVLLERQTERGGVIDLGDKDAVIDETWVRARPTTDDSGQTQVEIEATAVSVLNSDPRTRDYSSSDPRTRDSNSSDPRTRDYSSSDPRTRDSKSSDCKSNHSRSSTSHNSKRQYHRTNHSSSSNSRTGGSSSHDMCPNPSSEPGQSSGPHCSGSASHRDTQERRGSRGSRTFRSKSSGARDVHSGSNTGDCGTGSSYQSRAYRDQGRRNGRREEFGRSRKQIENRKEGVGDGGLQGRSVSWQTD